MQLFRKTAPHWDDRFRPDVWPHVTATGVSLDRVGPAERFQPSLDVGCKFSLVLLGVTNIRAIVSRIAGCAEFTSSETRIAPGNGLRAVAVARSHVSCQNPCKFVGGRHHFWLSLWSAARRFCQLFKLPVCPTGIRQIMASRQRPRPSRNRFACPYSASCSRGKRDWTTCAAFERLGVPREARAFLDRKH